MHPDPVPHPHYTPYPALPTIGSHRFWGLLNGLFHKDMAHQFDAWAEALRFATQQVATARAPNGEGNLLFSEHVRTIGPRSGSDYEACARFSRMALAPIAAKGPSPTAVGLGWCAEAMRRIGTWLEPKSEEEDQRLFSLEATLALGHLLASSVQPPYQNDPSDNPVPLLWDVALAWREWFYEVLRTREWMRGERGPASRRLRIKLDHHVGTYGVVLTQTTTTFEAAVCLRSSVQGAEGLVQIAQQAQAHMQETPWLDTAHEGNVQDAADRLSDAIRALYAYALARGATPPPDAPRY